MVLAFSKNNGEVMMASQQVLCQRSDLNLPDLCRCQRMECTGENSGDIKMVCYKVVMRWHVTYCLCCGRGMVRLEVCDEECLCIGLILCGLLCGDMVKVCQVLYIVVDVVLYIVVEKKLCSEDEKNGLL